MENEELSKKVNAEDPPKHCPACQAVWHDNAKFCGYCGTKLEEYKAVH